MDSFHPFTFSPLSFVLAPVYAPLMESENNRINLSSGTPWEPLIGFSRLIKVGDHIFISGTTASNAKGEIFGVGDPYLQTKRVIENVRTALEGVGAKLSDVVRTRMFVTDLTKLEHYARAHREFFEKIRPAATMLQVARLVDARMLINMEVDAVVGAKEVVEQRLSRY